MGVQSTVVRSAAGSEPSTNVLTATLTALAAGAALVLHAGVPWALALATALLAASGGVVYPLRAGVTR